MSGILAYVQNPIVQGLFIVALMVIACAAFWVMRERSKKAQNARKIRERYQLWA